MNFSKLKSFALTFFIWIFCFIVAMLLTSMQGGRSVSDLNVVATFPFAICGLVIAAAIAITVGRLKKIPAVAIGVVIGLVPSTIGVVWSLIFAKGFETPAIGFWISLWLAIPSGIASGLGALISNRMQRS